MKHDARTVLVVEDDRNQREIIKTILAKEGYYVEDVSAGESDRTFEEWLFRRCSD